MKNLHASTKWLLMATALLLHQAPSSASHTHNDYYISSSQGNDSYDGTSALKPWKNLDKIWLKDVLQPGDRVRLKRGDTWHGNIYVRGAGTPANPVLVSSYGDGADPIIYGDRYTVYHRENIGPATTSQTSIFGRTTTILLRATAFEPSGSKSSPWKAKTSSLKIFTSSVVT